MTRLPSRARVRSAMLRLAPEARTAALPLPERSPRLPDAPEILLIRPDHIGDVLFTGPAVRRAREAWPDAVLTLLVGPWAKPIADRLPELDRVVTLEFPWFDRRARGAPWRSYQLLRSAANELRTAGGRPYDAAIVLRDDDYWGAWLAARSGVPVRAGHSDAGVSLFATHVLPARLRPRHTAAANIALVDALAGRAPSIAGPRDAPLELRLTGADQAQAARLLEPLRSVAGAATPPEERGLIAVHPGSGAAVKRWRPSAWARVALELAAPGDAIVLTGGEVERGLTAEIARLIEAEQAGMPRLARAAGDTGVTGARGSTARLVLDLAGRTDIGSLAAVFARCRLVLGPDSGPLHVASAVGAGTVHLYGPADAARFGPWAPAERHRVVESRLPCAPCGRLDWPDASDHPCVRVIDADEVLAAARSCDASAHVL